MSSSDLSRYVLAISAAGAMLAGAADRSRRSAHRGDTSSLAIPSTRSWQVVDAAGSKERGPDLCHEWLRRRLRTEYLKARCRKPGGRGCWQRLRRRNGNVFVTVADRRMRRSRISMRMKPIETLSDAPNVPRAVRGPTTGNLAVANFIGTGWATITGTVAIYTGAKGNGMDIHQPNIIGILCAYDDAAICWSMAAP